MEVRAQKQEEYCPSMTMSGGCFVLLETEKRPGMLKLFGGVVSALHFDLFLMIGNTITNM